MSLHHYRSRSRLLAAVVAALLVASPTAPAIASELDGVNPEVSQSDARRTGAADENSGAPSSGAEQTTAETPHAEPEPTHEPTPNAETQKAGPVEPVPAPEPAPSPAHQSESSGLTNQEAPASQAALEPGVYTVTANPYVAGSDAPIGVNVYLSDSGFPPVRPQKNNATLRVGLDGSMEVDVPFTQEIFTLQSLSDGKDVSIKSVARGGKLAWGNNEPDPAYPDRITSVTAQLANASGEYTFGKATEYAVILLAEKHWDIHLSVDLAHAQRHSTEEFVQDYVDSKTGAKVRVSARANDPLIPALREASLRVSTPSADHDAVQRTLQREFVGNPRFASWKLSLESDGETLLTNKNIGMAVQLPTTAANTSVLRVTDSTAVALDSSSPAENVVAFTSEGLGNFAVVDNDSARRWSHRKDFESPHHTTMTYRSTGEAEWNYPGLDYESLDAVGALHSYLGVEGSPVRLGEARRLLSLQGSNWEISAYTFGFDLSYEGVPFANVAKHQAWEGALGGGLSSLSGTVPVRDAKDHVYLVKGTVGAGLQSVERINSRFENGRADFAIVNTDADPDSASAKIQVPLWNAATGKDRDIDTPQTPETEIAYVVVAREALTRIDAPHAAPGLVYTGKNQTGVADGDGYALSVKPSAVNAGSYVARATLKTGYSWADGSTAPVDIRWEIAPATLEARYPGESMAPNGVPRLEVKTTGFVNGETPSTAAAYVAPKVHFPERITAGGSYKLAPSGGSAANYRFTYHEGTLSVGHTIDPNSWKPGTYRITANLFVPAAQNDILGRTAFMTNPKNPLAPEGSAQYGIPLDPVSDNATLTVSPNGKRSLTVDLPNPAFTLIEFGKPSAGVSVTGVARGNTPVGPHSGGRITRAVIGIEGATSTATFTQSRVFAVPLSLDKTWNLSLEIDYASAKRVSDDTEVKVPGGTQTSPAPKPGVQPGPAGGTTPRPAHTSGPRPGLEKQPTRLRAGTYTVSANIWFSKSVTGLPLDPHITNGGFPPKDPVTNNAKLTVDSEGNGAVTVPIAIQSRIMTVRSLTGGGVISTAGGNALNSVTVDLGKIDPTVQTITRSMEASVTIGDLAFSIGGAIFKGSREHTWPASFEVAIAGVPTSGGGIVPEFLQAKLDGTPSADEAKLLKALETAKKANASSREADSEGGLARPESPARAGKTEMPRTGAVVASAGALLALALAGVLLMLRRRARNDAHQAPADHAATG